MIWTILDDLVIDDDAPAYIGAALTLNAECKFAACDARLETEIRATPDEEAPHLAYISAAFIRGDWRAAQTRSLRARHRLPACEPLYRLAFQAAFELDQLEEAEAFIQRCKTQFPRSAWPVWYEARLSEARENEEATEKAYADLRAGWPDDPEGWRDSSLYRRRRGRNAGALSLMEEAIERFPDNPAIHLNRVFLLAMSMQREAAIAACDQTCERFPDHIPAALRRAEIPVQFVAKDFDLATQRHAELIARFPEDPEVHAAAVRMQIRAANMTQAQILARQALSALKPSRKHQDVALLLAKVEEYLGDLPAAQKLCADLQNEFPNLIAAHVQLAECLISQGQVQAAEQVCLAAVNRFKFRTDPYVIRAKLAVRAGEVARALDIWSQVSALHPRDKKAKENLFVTRLLMTDHNDNATIASSDVHFGQERREGALANLMMSFESLSAPGAAGCEFGFVQRNFGAEPIGLLRWAEIKFADLLTMLKHRLEGVGEEAQTEVFIAGGGFGGGNEYFVTDKRYQFELHTFVPAGQSPPEQVLKQWLGRLQFLKRKLIQDLEKGEKLFVYSPGFALADADIAAFSGAVRAYGDSQFLLVQNATAENPDGRVVFHDAKIMIGHIPRIRRMIGERQSQPILFAHWAQMCAEARALRAARRAA